MKLKIIDNKNIELDGKKYVLIDTLTNEEILTALRRGVLSTTAGNIVNEGPSEIKKTGAKTFTLNGNSYTLDKERTEEQLLRDFDDNGFIELVDKTFLNLKNSGGGGGTVSSGNTLNRIKEFQKNYVNTAGTRTNPSADTGIATSNTLTDLLSLFYLGNYKDYIRRNKDTLEIAFLVGDRRASIGRMEWSEYFDFNSLTTNILILEDVEGQEYNFRARFDTNLNLNIADNHVGQQNYFGALFSISIRHKV